MRVWGLRWRRIAALLTVGIILPGGSLAARDADDTAWRDARRGGTMASFQGYLDRFPTGRHSSEAFQCLLTRARDLPLCTPIIEPAAGSALAATRAIAPTDPARDPPTTAAPALNGRLSAQTSPSGRGPASDGGGGLY